MISGDNIADCKNKFTAQYYKANSIEQKEAILDEMFILCIGWVSEVEKLHTLGYQHYDLRDDNAIYNFQTQKVTLVDFGLSGKYTDDPNELENIFLTSDHMMEMLDVVNLPHKINKLMSLDGENALYNWAQQTTCKLGILVWLNLELLKLNNRGNKDYILNKLITDTQIRETVISAHKSFRARSQSCSNKPDPEIWDEQETTVCNQISTFVGSLFGCCGARSKPTVDKNEMAVEEESLITKYNP